MLRRTAPGSTRRSGYRSNKRAQPDLPLHAGQRRTQAVVPPGRERDVLARVLPGDVERVRLREDLGVAVGAGEQPDHHGPAWHRYADDLGGRRGHPSGEQHRRVEPQHLVDGVGPELVTFAEELAAASGSSREQRDPVAEQVDGRLEAGREHQPRGRLQLRVRQADPFLLGADELAEQVVTRAADAGCRGGGPASRRTHAAPTRPGGTPARRARGPGSVRPRRRTGAPSRGRVPARRGSRRSR